ncbi:bis(5'-nucleosyl)-tetraphosphatase (symmetrical) YqeK [uncultured Ruminococcus sp.]|uniref:bis(5'-nucleosyl)-tetraphosphatase (symmetrical) YqeK n=1 Tax=uncultured Ruminococcus sp. TaxID=165186 RepID=UPI002930FC8C|nr:bis(5'-nucleosyl)-tetraphosphatase (symmetrical) YqeK [uncultured Ruminococcus sp.]
MNIEQYLSELDALSEYRRVHSLNVSKEAVRFAEKYGADVEKARLAGLLHDVTKETDGDKQLQIIEKGGIILSETEKRSPKLWHAISGACYVRDVLGIDDPDIFNAIRFHTTARAGMSMLEKVVFLADFTSAERDYPDIDIIREHAENSLEEGMLYGLKFTLSRLIGRGNLVSPDALAAYNEILLSEEQ